MLFSVSSDLLWKLKKTCTFLFFFFFFFFSGQHVWLLRSNRLLRLLRFSHLWSVVNKYWWEHHYYGSVHQRRMWALFFTMAVASHFAGLFFYLIALETALDPKIGEMELIPGFGTTTWAESDGLWTIQPPPNTMNDMNMSIGCDTPFGYFPRVNSTLVVCLQASSFARCVSGVIFFIFRSYILENGKKEQIKNQKSFVFTWCGPHLSYFSFFSFLSPCFSFEQHRYWRSMYWAVITMVTIGFGDIVPLTRSNTVFCTIMLYVGITITACAVANLTRMAAATDTASTVQ